MYPIFYVPFQCITMMSDSNITMTRFVLSNSTPRNSADFGMMFATLNFIFRDFVRQKLLLCVWDDVRIFFEISSCRLGTGPCVTRF